MERFRRLICYANAAHIEMSFTHEERPQVGIVKRIVFGGSFTHKRIGECEVIRLWCLPELKWCKKMIKIWMKKDFFNRWLTDFPTLHFVYRKLQFGVGWTWSLVSRWFGHLTTHVGVDAWQLMVHWIIYANFRSKNFRQRLDTKMIDGEDQKLTESDWDF